MKTLLAATMQPPVEPDLLVLENLGSAKTTGCLPIPEKASPAWLLQVRLSGDEFQGAMLVSSLADEILWYFSFLQSKRHTMLPSCQRRGTGLR